MRVYCLTLPVADLKISLNFYRHGLGVPADEIGELTDADDHFPLKLENGMYLVLTLRAGFDEFTAPNQQQTAPRGVSECILSCFVGSQNEVDEIVQRCATQGGTAVGPPVRQPWGYAGYVKDPDGHLWEVLFNDKMSA